MIHEPTRPQDFHPANAPIAPSPLESGGEGAIQAQALKNIGEIASFLSRSDYCTRARKRSVTNSMANTMVKITRMMVEAILYWKRSKATFRSCAIPPAPTSPRTTEERTACSSATSVRLKSDD